MTPLAPWRWMTSILVLIHGGVHLQQYLAGFSEIPIVGELFLLNAIGSLVIATLLIARKRLGVAGTLLLSAGSLAALAIARTVGLFGYVSTSFGTVELVAVLSEVGAVMVLLVAYARSSRGLSEFVAA